MEWLPCLFKFVEDEIKIYKTANARSVLPPIAPCIYVTDYYSKHLTDCDTLCKTNDSDSDESDQNQMVLSSLSLSLVLHYVSQSVRCLVF